MTDDYGMSPCSAQLLASSNDPPKLVAEKPDRNIQQPMQLCYAYREVGPLETHRDFRGSAGVPGVFGDEILITT